jgi:hypothetical protein
LAAIRLSMRKIREILRLKRELGLTHREVSQSCRLSSGASTECRLESRPHPEQGYRACLGLLRLGKRHGDDRLEAACRPALAISAPYYRTIKSILGNGSNTRRYLSPSRNRIRSRSTPTSEAAKTTRMRPRRRFSGPRGRCPRRPEADRRTSLPDATRFASRRRAARNLRRTGSYSGRAPPTRSEMNWRRNPHVEERNSC